MKGGSLACEQDIQDLETVEKHVWSSTSTHDITSMRSSPQRHLHSGVRTHRWPPGPHCTVTLTLTLRPLGLPQALVPVSTSTVAESQTAPCCPHYCTISTPRARRLETPPTLPATGSSWLGLPGSLPGTSPVPLTPPHLCGHLGGGGGLSYNHLFIPCTCFPL